MERSHGSKRGFDALGAELDCETGCHESTAKVRIRWGPAEYTTEPARLFPGVLPLPAAVLPAVKKPRVLKTSQAAIPGPIPERDALLPAYRQAVSMADSRFQDDFALRLFLEI